MTPETIALLAAYREKLRFGTLSDDDLRIAITKLRSERAIAMVNRPEKPAAKKTTTGPKPDTDALLKDLFS